MEEVSSVIEKLKEQPKLTGSKPVASEDQNINSVTLQDSAVCQVCRGTGWVYRDMPVGHEEFGKAIPCQCRLEALKKERQERMLRYCKLPEGTEHCTFERFKLSPPLEEAYSKALAIATGSLKWLTLVGPVDTGKTHLAIAICRRWLIEGKVARYVYTPLLLEELRQGYSDNERGYEIRLRHFMEVPLLVLDDLGVEKSTDWASEKMHIIIDYRYMQNLPLVVTTNQSLVELPGDTGHRLESRLKRMSAGAVVMVQAPEFRKVRNAIEAN